MATVWRRGDTVVTSDGATEGCGSGADPCRRGANRVSRTSRMTGRSAVAHGPPATTLPSLRRSVASSGYPPHDGRPDQSGPYGQVRRVRRSTRRTCHPPPQDGRRPNRVLEPPSGPAHADGVDPDRLVPQQKTTHEVLTDRGMPPPVIRENDQLRDWLAARHGLQQASASKRGRTLSGGYRPFVVGDPVAEPYNAPAADVHGVRRSDHGH